MDIPNEDIIDIETSAVLDSITRIREEAYRQGQEDIIGKAIYAYQSEYDHWTEETLNWEPTPDTVERRRTRASQSWYGLAVFMAMIDRRDVDTWQLIKEGKQ